MLARVQRIIGLRFAPGTEHHTVQFIIAGLVHKLHVGHELPGSMLYFVPYFAGG